MIHFYVNQHVLERHGVSLASLPQSLAEYTKAFPLPHGIFNWLLRTHLELKASGFLTRFSTQISSGNILVTHPAAVSAEDMPLLEREFVVCTKADWVDKKFVNLSIIQNPSDITRTPATFIPHWRQQGIIQRDPARGTTISRVAYLGLSSNLAAELQAPAFCKELQNYNLEFVCKGRGMCWQWRDYSEVDIVLAVRSFDGNTWSDKPASKLTNAWYAGVPALLGGNESAFNALRESELDFIAIQDPSQIVEAILFLRKNPEVYRRMVENGRQRADEFNSPAIVRSWAAFFEHIALPAFKEWHEGQS